ncbi:hypothetical protein V494_03589 [Pseudogymnoascus sp. VKM F-4513 (FW-928)]|nr:hypothetical protein V494_03589 [Pseudogymnoascus sp. VKM F-4513 (FW-928)]
MRKRSDKDNTTAVGVGAGMIASANSTVNLFLGGRGTKTREWMNGSTNTVSLPTRRGAGLHGTVTTINNERPQQPQPPPLPPIRRQSTTAVLPSPAPSNEPSPAHETTPNRFTHDLRTGSAAATVPVAVAVMEQQEGMVGEEGGVGSEETQGEQMQRMQTERMQQLMEMQRMQAMREIQERQKRQRERTVMELRDGEAEARDGRGEEAQWLRPVVQSPATEQLQTELRGGGTDNGGQTVRSPATEQGQANIGGIVQNPSGQHPPMTQQRNIPSVSQAAPASMTQHGHPYASQQAQQSPTTQQPPMTQQRNIGNAPQAVRSPSTGAVYSSHIPLMPTPPAKKRKMTSANHPSLKGMLPIIEHHLKPHGGMQGLAKNIERQRFTMLQRACDNDDYFYVALHQVFCLWSIDPGLTTRLAMPQGKTVLESSFAIMGQLLMGNKHMTPVHTEFFAMFPNHLSELMYRSDHYNMTVNNVSMFLARLSLEWQNYIHECGRRQYPPLVDELVNRFGILSPILQHIFFTATRRNIGFADDEYSAQMEQLFNHDQDLHRKMAARVNTAYPPTEREINERNNWQAQQYITLANMRAQRVVLSQAGPNVAHPSQQQAGQPPPNRPNVMPSEVLTASPQSTTFPSQHPPWPSPATSEHSPMAVPTRLPSQASQGHSISPNQQNMPRPYPANQMPSMQARQGQVNNVVRTASRNASRNASLSQFPGAGSAGSSPVMTNPVRRGSSSPYSSVAPIIASMPAGYIAPQQQQQQQQQPQQVARIPLIPPVGYVAPYQFPQPDRSALHQAHLRSPVLRPIDVDEGPAAKEPATRFYQAVQSFAVAPTTLLDPPQITELSFVVPEHIFPNVAVDKLSDPTAPMLREVRQGTLQYRIRCSRLDKGKSIEPSDFVVADTQWPPTIFMEMNDSVLEIRRKGHYGKDRPVDITPHVVDRGLKKENVLRISVPSHPKMKSDTPYSIAIEVVEVFRHQQIMDMCIQTQRITAATTIDDIRHKLSNSAAAEDDDVALVSANLTIDLADPFTARIFTTPVRGAACRHRECFDLETFLISRSTKPHEVACLPDVWKCPLCGGDASPRSLRVDDFLVSVRQKLESQGGLDVKAILVTEDGEWTVKPEALPAGRRKSRAGGSVPREDSKSSSPAVPSRQPSRVVEIIEVDDD